MDLEKEIKSIKNYFNNISITEFDAVLSRNGINQINSIADYNMEFLETISYKKDYINNELYKNKELFEYTIKDKIHLGDAA